MSHREPPVAEALHEQRPVEYINQSFLQIHRKFQVIYFKMLSFILKYIYIYICFRMIILRHDSHAF